MPKVFLAILVLLLSLPFAVFAQTITTFDVPGAQVTAPVSITPTGTVVGSYKMGNTTHAFVRYSDGSIITLDPPGTITSSFALAGNAAGQIMGGYVDSNSVEHGFLWSPDGTYTIIDVGSGSTHLTGMNAAGDICGWTFITAFLRKADGTLTTFTFGNPGSVATPTAINASDQITGNYLGTNNDIIAFVRNPDGTSSTFQVGSGGTLTVPQSINSAGLITGYDYGARSIAHGFLRTPDGKITSFGLGLRFQSTFSYAVNGTGTVAGFYRTSGGESHGFLRPASGPFMLFDVPGAAGTIIYDITDTGILVGQYHDPLGVHGFIATK